MVKVFIARGHGVKQDGGFDPGAAAGDWTEQKVADIAAPVIADRLARAGATVRDEGTDDPNYVGSTADANAWGADLTVSIHCDWSGGLDFHVLYHHASSQGRRCADDVVAAVRAAGHRVRGTIARDDLYILNHTDHTAVLVELGRIGDATIDTPEEIQALAGDVAAGLLDYLELADPGGGDVTPPPPPDPDTTPDPPPAGGDHYEDIMGTLTTVGRGDRGDDVKRAQAWLAAAGYPPSGSYKSNGQPDGIYGSGTETAARAFQSAKGIASDGIVGPDTWRKLAGA